MLDVDRNNCFYPEIFAESCVSAVFKFLQRKVYIQYKMNKVVQKPAL